MTLLAIVAIHTAANEPPKVRQVMNKIHRNVGAQNAKKISKENGAAPPAVMDGHERAEVFMKIKDAMNLEAAHFVDPHSTIPRFSSHIRTCFHNLSFSTRMICEH